MCDFFDDDNVGNGQDDDDEYPSICDRMRKMAEEAARQKNLGLPEEKKPEEPSPTAKSPRKRANFFLRSGGADRKSQSPPAHRERGAVRL